MTKRKVAKAKYKHIHFLEVSTPKKTTEWSCCHNDTGHELGEIKWFGRWRQYCFFPDYDTLYSAGCLKDIGDFINKLMFERKVISKTTPL